MIEATYELMCDCCSDVYGTSDSDNALWRLAEAEGWKQEGSSHYCPGCQCNQPEISDRAECDL